MKFKDLSGEELINKIKAHHKHIIGHRMWGTIFYEIHPAQEQGMKLKKNYKPETDIPGMFTEYHKGLGEQPLLKWAMNNKLLKNGFNGERYENKEGALKLHISLNNITEMDESVIMGLMELLIKESESTTNNISFFFKFIDPANRRHERFRNTDQLTLYFDKYSSAADMIHLSKKIEDYLLESGVPQNKIKRGPKDSFGFNSFVSARFDTNRLLGKYDVYKFFDLELEKFFKTHPVDVIDIPICAFEAVFNTVLLSDSITNIKAQGSGLSRNESKAVQAEFEKMLTDPKAYLKNSELLQDKLIQLKKNAMDQQVKLTNLQKEHAATFRKLLNKLLDKSGQLGREGYPDKAIIADTLYTKLKNEFDLYQNSGKSKKEFHKFETDCNKAIQLAKPHLKEHRGWKEVFVNLAIGIATLGSAFVIHFIYTRGNAFFFKVNTDSVNTLDELNKTIGNLNSEPPLMNNL